MSLPHVCLPVNLDAFVLNQNVCSATGLSLVAPITQPNYLSLRLSSSHIQHDVLPNVDLHNASDGLKNPRISSVYQTPFKDAKSDPEPAQNNLVNVDRKRLGVYLHWTVPRAYRAATSQAAPPPTLEGDAAPKKSDANPQPSFPPVPNRWLIVRILHDKWMPASANPDKVSAWVVESDRLRKVEELSLDENGQPIDLETDVAPFVAYENGTAGDPDVVNNQAENYIGSKTPLAQWTERKSRKDEPPSSGSGNKYVDLTVMNSSNPLFADYSPHNGNVFSIKDNLHYGNGQYLDNATCDYIILGWHSDFADDPLWKDASSDLATRLQRQFCAAPGDTMKSDPGTDRRRGSKDKTRLVCYAAKYNVEFSPEKPRNTPADTFAGKFTADVDMEPVAVGTTPLDAVLSFFQAHGGPKDPTLSSAFGDTGSQTAANLMQIRELLYATEDDYDSRVKAADLVFAHNFARSPGGFRWRFDKKKDSRGPPIAPSSDIPDPNKVMPNKDTGQKDPLALMSETSLIAEINDAQRTYDTASSKLDLVRWNLFSEWFKYLSDPLSGSQKRLDFYTSRVLALRSEAETLSALVASKQDYITRIANLFKSKDVELKKVAFGAYFKRNDPTLCLAGVDAGWDPEYLKATPTQFVDTFRAPSARPGAADIGKIIQLLADVSKFGKGSDAGSTAELSNLSSSLVKILTEASKFDSQGTPLAGFKSWVGQPFCPQFVEWEAVYHHIPWNKDNWSIELTNSALSSSNHNQVMYTNPKKLSDLGEVRADSRHISGRMLVVPQPSFSLGAVVAQVLDASNNDKLPKEPINFQDAKVKEDLIKATQQMKFISGEMTGITDALVTAAVGQHVKPNLRTPGGTTLPMGPAITEGGKIQMIPKDFDTIAGETGRTPYGTLFTFPDDRPSPFKGVQHGQLAITKLVVVDKFGQAVACPFPKRAFRPNDPAAANQVPDFIHPCLSEQLIPTVLGGELNTVYTTKDTNDHATTANVPMTPFIQLNPAINQEARLNAAFLRPNPDAKSWTPCNEWDNPVFGWLIVNYADSALQFFTADGTFYTSRQFGGPTGTIETLDWLPFEPPPPEQAAGKVSPQLIDLIAKLGETADGTGVKYLKALWDIVRAAIPTMPFPPSDYAPYANAIVGKPLALVNAGWSIELAQPPLWRQHTLPLPDVPNPPANGVDPLRDQAKADMSKYSFKVKIGDAERPFDGVVAYWDVPDSANSTKTNFNKMSAYSTPRDASALVEQIEPATFPPLTPYFLDPDAPPPASGRSFSQLHTDHMQVRTLLIDPYTPVHAYTGVLPIQSLALPAWTIAEALKNMTAFFTMGPLLLSRDVPHSYDASNPLKPDSWLSDQTSSSSSGGGDDPIKLPVAGGKGMWNWLQPYMVSDAAAGGGTHYNALPVGQEDGRLRLDPAPYTFVEGFLQLARPLAQSEDVAPRQAA